jgi:hypothetical protein
MFSSASIGNRTKGWIIIDESEIFVKQHYMLCIMRLKNNKG